MVFLDGLQDLATPLGVVVMLLSLASGSAAAIYVWRRGPKEPTPDDLRIMSATTFGLIRHLNPLLYFILGSIVPWLVWPVLLSSSV